MAESKEEYFQGKVIYLVNVGIIKAINLPKVDTIGKADGYVKVECLHRKFRTITIKNNLNPEWNAKTQFQFFRKPTQLKFRCIDWNTTKDTPIGEYILPLKDEWFERGNKGYSDCVTLDKAKRGQIEITVSCQVIKPFEFLDKIEDCKAKLNGYREDIQTCKNQIDECKTQANKEQQAIAAYQSQCDNTQSECDQYRNEKNECESTGRKCDADLSKWTQTCNNLDRKYKELEKTYSDVSYKLTEMGAEYARNKQQAKVLYETKQSYGATQDNTDTYETKHEDQEYGITGDSYADKQQQQQQDDEYENEEDTDVKYKLLQRINKYTENLGRYEGDDNEYDEEDEIEEYDTELFGDIIGEYKTQKDDEQNDEANKYLIEIQKWYNGCNEEIYRKKDKCLQTLDYEMGTDERQFFTDFYIQLNKFFFCLQLIGATLEVFGDEIKQLTKKKKINAITFEDLAGKIAGDGGNGNEYEDEDETKRSEYDEPKENITVWGALYDDLDFVIEEVGNILSPYMRGKPLQKLCELISEFLSNAYLSNHTMFTKLIAHYICQEIVLEEISANPNHLIDDAMGATILILNDKKGFCDKLQQSIQVNATPTKQKDDDDENEEEDNEDEYGNTDDVPIEDQFERILALIIVSVCLLDCLGGETKLDEKDKKEINEKLQEVLARCGQLNIDEKSQKLIKQFFGYFFAPESSGGTCCGGDGGGIGGFFWEFIW